MSSAAGITSALSTAYTIPTAPAPAVAKSADTGLAQTAVTLASVGDVVATLGGGSSAALTYDAAGLLNAFVQAGSAPSSGTVTPGNANSQSAQNATNQAIVNTLPAGSVAAGVYSSSGTLQGLPSDTTTNWANALKANPALASSVIADSFNQGIVGTLSVTA